MTNENFIFIRIEDEEDDYLVDLADGGLSDNLSCAADEYLDEMEDLTEQVRESATPYYLH